MKIYRPIKTDYRTQAFGENNACVKVGVDGKMLNPPQVILGAYPDSCPAGCTKFYPAIGLKGHNGWDMALYHGEPIYFPVLADTRWQVVNEIDASGGIGVNVYALDPVPFESLPIHMPGQFKMIEAQYNELGGKLYPMFKFWHCKSVVVPNYSLIKAGDLIAYGDSTGASSGDHLHWGMKIHNGHGFSIDSDNGYAGAFDHQPYYENTFVLDIIKPSFTFTKTLRKGETNTDIGVMQSVLVRYGYMAPIKADETGIYGNKTAAAVLAFQIGEGLALSNYERYVLRGSIAGPKTVIKLNEKLKNT